MKDKSSGKTGWRGLSALFLGMAALCAWTVGAQPSPKALRLLQSVPLPRASNVPTDIRWAGKSSVYVSWNRSGVTEIGLDGTHRRVVVPNVKAFREKIDPYFHNRHLAVSPTSVAVAASGWTVAWGPLHPKPGISFSFQSHEVPYIQDIDLFGDRILLMGSVRRGETFESTRDVAWVGTLSAQMEDLKPVLYDSAGPGAPNYFNCRTNSVGAVRFLGDGSFVIAPGFQDGVHLYDPAGRQVQTWSNEELGLDAHPDCISMTKEEEAQFRTSDAAWQTWLNRHHLPDDILPLPQGPGLLVRSWGTDGQVHWTLKVLHGKRVETYTVPIKALRPGDRLHGDVRDGQIVLLLSSGLPWSVAPENLPAEVFVMELPST